MREGEGIDEVVWLFLFVAVGALLVAVRIVREVIKLIDEDERRYPARERCRSSSAYEIAIE